MKILFILVVFLFLNSVCGRQAPHKRSRLSVINAAKARIEPYLPATVNYTNIVLESVDAIIQGIPSNSPLRTKAVNARNQLANYASTHSTEFGKSAKSFVEAQRGDEEGRPRGFDSSKIREILKEPGMQDHLHAMMMEKLHSAQKK